jgi:hypothetical protein
MFDPERLQYYLLARDIEVMKSDPLGALTGNSREILADSEELLTALTAVKARAAAVPESTGNDLPVWVRKLAPPEVKAEAEDASEEAAFTANRRTAVLDEKLVTILSEAMDSEDELEVTPELLAPYVPTTPVPTPVERLEGANGGGFGRGGGQFAHQLPSHQPGRYRLAGHFAHHQLFCLDGGRHCDHHSAAHLDAAHLDAAHLDAAHLDATHLGKWGFSELAGSDWFSQRIDTN